MFQSDNDTICAIATAPGKSGIGVVRISGPAVPGISHSLLGHTPPPRRATLCQFRDQDHRPIDQGIAIYYPAPGSFTGEDVLELQGHGGVFVLQLVLKAVLACGARLARPGEFSERAFLNDKLDLAQLEAIADLIDASTEQAARSAMQTLDGRFSRLVNDLVAAVTDLRVYIEAAIDFVDEEIDFLTEGRVLDKLLEIRQQLQQVFSQARQGALLKQGLQVVIAGQPNAGKSSLLNALAGTDTAIVTEIPGTTRDLLRETISVDGMPVHLTDTAGLRDSSDPVEQEGIRRARQAIETADRILLLIDASRYPQNPDSIHAHLQDLGLDSISRLHQRMTVVFNKIDLVPGTVPAIVEANGNDADEIVHIYLSSLTGAGLPLLRQHLLDCAGYQQTGEDSFIARQRHLQALQNAGHYLDLALDQLRGGAASELVAEDLRLVQRALGEITGDVGSDDLLGRIFASFCIGK